MDRSSIGSWIVSKEELSWDERVLIYLYIKGKAHVNELLKDLFVYSARAYRVLRRLERYGLSLIHI